jgi:pseudomonalisin/xanthomonalisin
MLDLSPKTILKRPGRRRSIWPGILIAGCAMLRGTAALAEDAWVPTAIKAFSDKTASVERPLDPQETVHLLVALKLRNRTRLDARVASIVRSRFSSGSAPMRPDEAKAQFAPSASQAQSVVDYLVKAGFADAHATGNNLFVVADGTAAAVNKAFNTPLAHVRRGRKTGIANTAPAELPASLAGIVQSVMGLQTLDQFHTMYKRAASVSAGGGVAATQLAGIYGAGGLQPATHAVVGIIAEGNLTPTINDLYTFETQNGYPGFTPTVVYGGAQSDDTSNEIEWNLDSQTLLAVSGGVLASMIFYVAPTLNDPDVTLAFNAAISAGIAKTINSSLGVCETSAVSDGTVAAEDQLFELAIAQGQTIAVAAGDDGSAECAPTPGQDYPASSPYVIAVGGTTLVAANGAYQSETAWVDGGGGPSVVEAQPYWQNGIVPGTARGVPDLAFDADPDSGITIIVSGAPYGLIGGTSLSSPIFVGLWARIQSAAGISLRFPGDQIYHFSQAQRPLAFHDVTTGSNGGYSAAPGWDYTTGFGSLNAANVRMGLDLLPIGAIAAYLMDNKLHR